MSAAVKAKYLGDKSPAIAFLDKLTGLIDAGDYKGASNAFLAFEKEHPQSDFMIEEAVPYRVQKHLQKTLGATPFVIYTLRNPTWSTEVTRAFHDAGKFEAFVNKMKAEIGKK